MWSGYSDRKKAAIYLSLQGSAALPGTYGLI